MKRFVVIGMIAVLSLHTLLGYADAAERIRIANPASVYCVESGYTLEIRTNPDGGQYGVCIFPDGNECEEWAFFRKECGAGYRTIPEVNTEKEGTPEKDCPTK